MNYNITLETKDSNFTETEIFHPRSIFPVISDVHELSLVSLASVAEKYGQWLHEITLKLGKLTELHHNFRLYSDFQS